MANFLIFSFFSFKPISTILYLRHTILIRSNAFPKQLEGFPILLLKSEADLTKRELEPIDFVYKSYGRIHDIAFAMLGEDVTRFDVMAFSSSSSTSC